MPDAPSGSAPAERIGVALCTYNGARYLQAQLDSILDQDLPVSEVVIGDDGSSDQTLPLLQAFEVRAQALGIRVEIARHPRNLGYVRNVADALQRCQADILFLCDQDDVWHPGRVRRYVQRFHAEPGLMLVHSDARLVDAQGAPLGQRLLEVLVVHPAEVELERSGRASDAILLRNFVTGATCALRRSLLQGALPVPPGWSHDEWLAVHASLRGGLDMLAEPTIDYRQHGNNQIGASRRGFLQRLRHLDLFDGKARQRTAGRLLALDALLVQRGVRVAPERFQGLSALAWRMAWSRLQLYRRAGVQARWIAHDAPRLFARLANVCLAGAGWRGVRAAPSPASHHGACVRLARPYLPAAPVPRRYDSDDNDDFDDDQQDDSPLWRRRLITWSMAAVALGLGFLIPYTLYLNQQVTQRFGELRWQIPTRVYARPLVLTPGKAMDAATLKTELAASAYRDDGQGKEPATYAVNGGRFVISSRGYNDVDGRVAPRRVELR
ncbi:hypothetical protein G6F57_014130 [Rhizopus arrhizus]|nr:hypothetical protein G6F57_014130 [Rhizopus arrhizus]